MGSTICSLPARFAEFYRGGVGGSCTLVKGRAQRARCGKSLGICMIASCMHTHYQHSHFLVLKLGVHTHPPRFIGGGSGGRRVILGVDQKAWGAILGTESEA